MSEASWSIPLPPDAGEPVEVYLNSVKLDPADYAVEGRWVRLRRPVDLQPELGFWRRVMLGVGIGVYGDLKGDQVDISYRLGGEVRFDRAVTVIPPTP